MTSILGCWREFLHPRLVAAVIATSLAGCAGRPEAVLRPIALPVDGGSAVNMLVATTRAPSDDPGLLFGGERGRAISFGKLVVSIPPDGNRKIGEVQWPAHAAADPKREFAVLDVEKVASMGDVVRWFRQRRSPHRQVLIFVHGFNNTYADAVFGFAQIVHDSGIDAAPVLFTWPSRGSVFSYLYDRESANYSRRALEDAIIQATRSPDVDDVTILAHSMGTWLTAEALRGVAMREKVIPAKIRNVVLASPDIDVDVFRRQFIEMGPRRPRFTIFTSTRDKALEVSRWLAGGVDRVGGSDLTPHAELFTRLGISVIDTSTIDSADPIGHNSFAGSPAVVRLLGRRLASQSFEGGRAALSDGVGIAAVGAADAAGSVLRATATAAETMVDRKARDELAKEIHLGPPTIVDGRSPY